MGLAQARPNDVTCHEIPIPEGLGLIGAEANPEFGQARALLCVSEGACISRKLRIIIYNVGYICYI